MSREALLTTCPKCGNEILEAEWDFIWHMPSPRTIHADPTAITPTTEALCIITGRPTYGHYTRGPNHHLGQRDTHWHKWHDCGQPTHVFPAHQCGTTLPGTPIDFTPPTYEVDPDQPCPY